MKLKNQVAIITGGGGVIDVNLFATPFPPLE
jgi:hypothetical protein